MNFKISKKMRVLTSSLMVLAFIFSIAGVSFVEAAPLGVKPVSAERVSAPFVIVKAKDAPSVTSVVNKAEVVSVGKIDATNVAGIKNRSTNVACSYVDFNQDGEIDTRDMIAYLNAWASKDVSADMNGNKIVDTNDYNMFISSWKLCQSSECSVSDFNRDRMIDTLDILAFLNAWSSKDDSADVNGDGRVSGMDIPFFFSTWKKCNV